MLNYLLLTTQDSFHKKTCTSERFPRFTLLRHHNLTFFPANLCFTFGFELRIPIHLCAKVRKLRKTIPQNVSYQTLAAGAEWKIELWSSLSGLTTIFKNIPCMLRPANNKTVNRANSFPVSSLFIDGSLNTRKYQSFRCIYFSSCLLRQKKLDHLNFEPKMQIMMTKY